MCIFVCARACVYVWMWVRVWRGGGISLRNTCEYTDPPRQGLFIELSYSLHINSRLQLFSSSHFSPLYTSHLKLNVLSLLAAGSRSMPLVGVIIQVSWHPD